MATLRIDKPIGLDWFGDGISYAGVRDFLEGIPADEPLTVLINSPGGSVTEGFGIYNALRERKPTVYIEGAAWSIASLIAAAGREIVARPASSIMIHDAWGFTVGNAEEHLRSAEALDGLSRTMASIYASTTGKDQETIRKMMVEETWFTPEEAKEFGFVHRIEDAGAGAMAAAPPWKMWAEAAKAMHFRRWEEFAARHGGAAAAGAKSDPPDKTTKMMKEEMLMEDQTKPAAPAADKTQGGQAAPQPQPAAPPQPQPHGQQQPPPGPLPSPNIRAEDQTLESLLRGKSAQERRKFLVREFNHLRQAFPLFEPLAANTYNTSPPGALMPAIVSSVALTVLQHRLAPLQAFARTVTQGRIGRRTIQVPIATTQGTTQSNPTNFEPTSGIAATISNRPVTPDHIVTFLHFDWSEVLSGYDLEWFLEIKAAEFADAIMSRVITVMTTTNFTGSNNVAIQAANFTAERMKDLWALLVRAPRRYAILRQDYFKRLLPDNLESFNPLEGWTYPGWDGVFPQTLWTGGATALAGFCCNPQAIVVAAGLPLEPMRDVNIPTSTVLTVENIGLSVEQWRWYSPATRTTWMTWEVCFGAALGDASAGVIIRDAAT